jgi:hypothetical protein
MVLTVSYLTLLNQQATQIHGDKLTGDHMIELHPKNRFVSKFFFVSLLYFRQQVLCPILQSLY